jgi:hypothetical protein
MIYPSRHVTRKHSRPFKCPIERCTSKGFGSKIELERHILSVHRCLELFCSVDGCRRSQGAKAKRPFHRPDNVKEHIQRVHAAPKEIGNESEELYSGQSLADSSSPTPNIQNDESQKVEPPSSTSADANTLPYPGTSDIDTAARNVIEDLQAEVKRLREMTAAQTRIIEALTKRLA